MLTATFLIFVFIHSVIAAGTPRSPNLKNMMNAVGVSAILLNNPDHRLVADVWVRVVPAPAPQGAKYKLDGVIRFGPGGDKGGVRHLDLLRLPRKEVLNVYKVDRERRRNPAVPGIVQADVPSNEWRYYLEDTYWRRIPELVGAVSNSRMIWKF